MFHNFCKNSIIFKKAHKKDKKHVTTAALNYYCNCYSDCHVNFQNFFHNWQNLTDISALLQYIYIYINATLWNPMILLDLSTFHLVWEIYQNISKEKNSISDPLKRLLVKWIKLNLRITFSLYMREFAVAGHWIAMLRMPDFWQQVFGKVTFWQFLVIIHQGLVTKAFVVSANEFSSQQPI